MPPGTTQAAKTSVATQLAAFLVAAAILIPAVTPGGAVAGGVWIKTLFLARMAGLVIVAHWMLRRRSLSWSAVGLNRPRWGRFLVALAAGVAMTVVFSAVARAIIVGVGLPAPNYSVFAPIKGNLSEYLFWAVPVTIGTAALGEELIFRGFVTDALQRLLAGSGPCAVLTAIVTQAVIFGALHYYQGSGGMIAAGVTGLALGLTWLIAGRNLWAGIVLHALLDGFAMTAIYLGYVAT